MSWLGAWCIRKPATHIYKTGHNRTEVHVNSQRLWQHKHGLHNSRRQTRCVPSVSERGSWHGIPLLTKKLPAINSFCKKEILFSHWSLTGYINHRQEQAPCQGTAGQHQTDTWYFLWIDCLGFALFGHLLIYWPCVCLVFIFVGFLLVTVFLHTVFFICKSWFSLVLFLKTQK